MRAKVYVTLRKSVLDPQGKAIEHALGTLGFSEARGVRMGKYIELELADAPKERAEQRVREMCEKLLANTVIEDYRIELS